MEARGLRLGVDIGRVIIGGSGAGGSGAGGSSAGGSSAGGSSAGGSAGGSSAGRGSAGGGGSGGGDTQFFSGDTALMLATPAVPGAFAALSRLVPRFEEVWLVSKCGERVQRHTRQWLDHHDFAGRTGIPRGNIRFCLRRPDKAIHCADLGITHFVDDKLDVHEALRGVVPHRYLFGPQRGRPPAWVQHTLTWAELEAAIVRQAGG